jgi:hypothetical protein
VGVERSETLKEQSKKEIELKQSSKLKAICIQLYHLVKKAQLSHKQ